MPGVEKMWPLSQEEESKLSSFNEHLLIVQELAKSFHVYYLILSFHQLQGTTYYYLHYTDEESETQKG